MAQSTDKDRELAAVGAAIAALAEGEFSSESSTGDVVGLPVVWGVALFEAAASIVIATVALATLFPLRRRSPLCRFPLG